MHAPSPQAERKRRRSAAKSARRKARKQKLADEKLISRLQPGLGLNNPYEKRKLREELQAARAAGRVVAGAADDDEAAAGREYQTSAKFFQKMQERVEGMVRGDDEGGQAKKRRKGPGEAASGSAATLFRGRRRLIGEALVDASSGAGAHLSP